MLFHILGSPLDDEIVMGEDKSCAVKNVGGNNSHVIYFSNEDDFTHTQSLMIQIPLVKYSSSDGRKQEEKKTMNLKILSTMTKQKH